MLSLSPTSILFLILQTSANLILVSGCKNVWLQARIKFIGRKKWRAIESNQQS